MFEEITEVIRSCISKRTDTTMA